MKILATTLKDKKDQYNAMVASGTTLDELKGNVIDVVGYIIYEKDVEDGSTQKITTFKLADGTFAGGVSSVVLKATEAYISTFGEITEDSPARFKIVSDSAKGGREFINLMLV